MSYTEIYKFTKAGNAVQFAEVRNSWRGAMAVWNILETRYLPPYIPSWNSGKAVSRFSSCDDKLRQQVWGLWQDEPRMKQEERIVMMSTFDNVIVLRKDIDKLVAAFMAFEGETSLDEQANVIELLVNSKKPFLAIAWNQTSVSEGWDSKGQGRANGDTSPYNIKKQKDHWSLFEELEKSLVKGETT